ncbi:hypothetical protein T4C_1029 [Trichinella pseudospiralis]|uniref:Uncharacterized protein n=1 Tax=Trichinella pseudospiralis TaxID=6337 RepID=A0A0V1GJR0_TRIPS|nr:hypothetical protein T4C_1029 [Trichinella pseudospiralis]
MYLPGPRFKCTSKRGSAFQQEGWGSRIAQGNGEVQILISGRDGAVQAKGEVFISSYTGKQELGGIRVHLVVRTSDADLGLEHSVVVLRTVCRLPAFDPLFEGERPNSEIKTIELS